jgi:hypothetical protein
MVNSNRHVKHCAIVPYHPAPRVRGLLSPFTNAPKIPGCYDGTNLRPRAILFIGPALPCTDPASILKFRLTTAWLQNMTTAAQSYLTTLLQFKKLETGIDCETCKEIRCDIITKDGKTIHIAFITNLFMFHANGNWDSKTIHIACITNPYHVPLH